MFRRRPRAERDRLNREQANEQSGFLKLPLELRQEIYNYILPTNIFIRHHLYQGLPRRACPKPKPDFQRGNTWWTKTTFPALLQTCRQIRADTIPIFYSRTTACFGGRDLFNQYRRKERKKRPLLQRFRRPKRPEKGRRELGRWPFRIFLDVLEVSECSCGRWSVGSLRGNARFSRCTRDDCAPALSVCLRQDIQSMANLL